MAIFMIIAPGTRVTEPVDSGRRISPLALLWTLFVVRIICANVSQAFVMLVSSYT